MTIHIGKQNKELQSTPMPWHLNFLEFDRDTREERDLPAQLTSESGALIATFTKAQDAFEVLRMRARIIQLETRLYELEYKPLKVNNENKTRTPEDSLCRTA
jgi:hypothetical protein